MAPKFCVARDRITLQVLLRLLIYLLRFFEAGVQWFLSKLFISWFQGLELLPVIKKNDFTTRNCSG